MVWMARRRFGAKLVHGPVGCRRAPLRGDGVGAAYLTFFGMCLKNSISRSRFSASLRVRSGLDKFLPV